MVNLQKANAFLSVKIITIRKITVSCFVTVINIMTILVPMDLALAPTDLALAPMDLAPMTITNCLRKRSTFQ